MSIPLNIDTPTGIPFTVNKTIYVDSVGRITMNFAADIRPVINKDGVYVKFLDAKREITIQISEIGMRKLAYEMLGMADEINTKRIAI